MAELQVSRKNIAALLGTMENVQFIVPDYQRPYQWDYERCETLWNDIVEFHSSESFEKKKEYFLGTIVTYKNKQGNIEVIDGQQRLTSLLLLLRALYFQLEQACVDTKTIINLKSKIAPCIWELNELTGEKIEGKIRLRSLVATENDTHLLHQLLEKGKIEDIGDNKKSIYSVNYYFFLEKSLKYAQDNPTEWESLCLCILKQCIILPIECEDIDSALTIFSTLNNRGMPLSDADIFKSLIYKTITDEIEKQNFISKWKEFIEITELGGFSLNDIFRYYTHIKRAENTVTEKEIGLRRFYTDKNNSILSYNLVLDLLDLASFWKEITINSVNSQFLDLNGAKWLQCLKLYPNEFWRYVISVYYVTHKQDFNSSQFSLLLKKMVAFLYAKFLLSPTVSAIKTEVYKACVDIYHGNFSGFTQLVPDNSHFENSASGKITRGILLLYAYLYSDKQTLLPDNFDVEHIFPKKWQDTNYNGWSYEDAQKYLESFGNKIVLEKRINIQAGNNYFGKKKEKYITSDVCEAREDLATATVSDWDQKAIILREQKIIEKLTSFFQSYK